MFNGKNKLDNSENKIPKTISARKIALISITGIIAALAVGYGAISIYLNDKFFFGTVINGVNVSGKTVEEANSMINEKMISYSLEVQERNNKKENITANQIDLNINFLDEVTKIKQEQKSYLWGTYIFKNQKNTAQPNINYNEDKLKSAINSLDAFNTELVSAPVNAYVYYNEDNKQFEIKEEDNGNTLKRDETEAGIIKAINNLDSSINFDKNEYYINAEITKENETLLSNAQEMNKLCDVTITYKFGDKTEIVDKEKIKDWIKTDENNQVVFDIPKVESFIEYIARNYNTLGIKRNFKTNSGETITVKGGNYGWWLNKNKEKNTLIEAIRAGENIVKEPMYIQKAASYNQPDIGNSYAEVNLTTQHMFVYVEGALVFESDFVSGKPSNGHATPPGTYGITYLERNATLKGENYATPVDYWMPFNEHIGFHDAVWQSAFGGKRYLTYGSHGCINLPFDKAKELFGIVKKGFPVVVY